MEVNESMVRSLQNIDVDFVLSIWLEASIKAHDFVGADFWQKQLNAMRDVYIPNSETYVFEENSNILGFYSLVENTLAAIFVAPPYQGQGIGKKLMSHAKSKRDSLTLNVYKKNTKSFEFYLSQGFVVVGEKKDGHTKCSEYTMCIENL